MQYLDFESLERIDPVAYRGQKPYPWINPARLITEEGYERLRGTLPELSRFERRFGVKRNNGQQSHDRYMLEYHEDLELEEPWKRFTDEVRSERYRAALCRLIGARSVKLNLHWTYTPSGCSVSPHCDSTRKLGSHIFYFNTEADWDDGWGGETLILDDGGRFRRRSAPGFEDFAAVTRTVGTGNRSLLFSRLENSWHGMREIRCPPDRLRKVFIVVISSDGPIDTLRSIISGRHRYRY